MNNKFYRFASSIDKTYNRYVSGINFISEESRFDNNDSVTLQSYQFSSFDAFIKSNDTSNLQYQLKVGQRLDNRPKNNSFSKATVGRKITFDNKYEKNPFQQIGRASCRERV